MPKLPTKSTIYVVVNDNKMYYDSFDYYQNIIVDPYPAFDYVLILEDSFEMGSVDFGFSDEMPLHNVSLTNSLYVSSNEISQRLYSLLMNENPSEIKYHSCPVYNVE